MITTYATDNGYTATVKDFFYYYKVIVNKKIELAVNHNAPGHETKEELIVMGK